MDKIKEFVIENRFVLFISVLLLLLICWVYHDFHRNDGINHNTDTDMADLDRRMQSIESRLNSLSDRIDKAQETISGTLERVERSRENAEKVAGGINAIETRLDSAIQRSGRIQNIIDKIEEGYRQGKTSSSPTNLAK